MPSDPMDPEPGCRISEHYTAFADAYARGDERRFSETMAEFVLGRAKCYQSSPLRRVADVACGIGAACVVFANQGLSVTGIDKSAEMLRNARVLAGQTHSQVNFLQQDMRDLDIEHRVDLITCMYDSLNFMLVEADLEAVYRRFWNCLEKNGLLCFDMYTIRGLAEYWGTKCEIHSIFPGHFVATRTSWDYDSATNTKHFFGFSLSSGQWHRWEECHVVRAYPVSRVIALLEQSGFVIREITDWDRADKSITLNTIRFVVVAQRIQ